MLWVYILHQHALSERRFDEVHGHFGLFLQHILYTLFYGYQGYQYVYLNDDGITIMVSGSGSKVEEWQAEYPGP